MTGLYEIETIGYCKASLKKWPDGFVTLLIEDPVHGNNGIVMSPESAQELSKFLSGE